MKRVWHAWKSRRRWQKIAIVLSVLVLVTGGSLYAWLLVGLPPVDSLEDGLALPSTRIYDRQGRLLYQIADPHTGVNEVIPLDQMSGCVVQATLATEDVNFYHHPGVDIEGVARALWINLKGGEVVAGGSTITQQVARNLLLDPEQRAERSLRRKLREGILALELTQHYSRDEILALYLNQTYYGNLAYGIEAASRAYFGKSAGELSLAECALLAGLPQAPSQYDPLSNPEAAKDRQRVVLDLMVRHGEITQDQADQAYDEELQFASTPFPIEAPHFVTAVWTQLERNYPEQIYEGGLTVTTTLDLDWQHAAEDAAQRHLERLNNPASGPSHNARNAALVSIDPETGQVLAMLGSPDYFNERIDGAVNAALAPRQPGSALKPFTYAAAFDPSQPDPWTPATMVLDIGTPFVTRRLESYTPSNYGMVEHGPVLVREALASSYNIPAVIALDHIGLDALVSLTTRLGITTLTDTSRFDLSLTLGGGEVRLLELTAAYAALANGGYRVNPVMILEVRDRDGNVLYEWKPTDQPSQVIDPRVTFLITDILSDNTARIPSFGAGSVLNIGRPAAAKTGTTTDFRDNWTVGYTPDLVTGVWVGNADNTPMVDVSGISGAGPIWNEFMRRVLQGTTETEFTVPEGVVQAEVCATSGLLPTDACPQTRWDWFIEGTEPTEPDNLYQTFTLDTRTGLLADDTTPPEDCEDRVYLVLPPEARDWALRQGIPQPPVGAQIVGGEQVPVRLLSPDPYTVFRLSPQLPDDEQRIRLTIAVPTNAQSVTYVMDGTPLVTTTASPFDTWWTLQPGEHDLTAEVTLRDGSTLTTENIHFRVGAWVPPDERPTSGLAE
ncbi:MAG TPA: penicillin-binding protein 1C [Aggregatilinea sp.]|uniref:penicillin-binding protein 1C n=1 Tax=Aggregatilinea sp. TaxID=2806333 RepID=UPI002C198D64|nr:penicillin-binding protein 1C [Aggregatilinea sp.]HML23087.1 penicillin-binding protein 1C [Aggregatilinea sp.]